jgi:hypothetical protein
MSQLVIWAPFVKVNWNGMVADLVKPVVPRTQVAR